jgi:uncharacterized protein with HEPN domain
MKIEACKRLRDIADCCAAAGRFAAGKTFSDYQTDDMLRSAIERKLGIIGEAFVKLEETDPAQVEQFPELRKIVGMRNRIVHGYDNLDEELVWDVVRNKLPALQKQVESLLEQK